MKKPFRFVTHVLIVLGLTVLTQIGGLAYVVSLLFFSSEAKFKELKRFGVFTLLYLALTFLVVPYLATVFGREKISSDGVRVYHPFYVLANRNYVKSELNDVLKNISADFRREYEDLEVVVLDANFPFFDGFPLLPHLSHNDGKKVDLAFIYKNEIGNATNQKISRLGYGVYEEPAQGEYNQPEVCRKQGFRQYDFPKYLSFGRVNTGLKFDDQANQKLIRIITDQPEVGKIFVEPHLKTRLHLSGDKIRYQGCHSVRHDDHIHFQLK